MALYNIENRIGFCVSPSSSDDISRFVNALKVSRIPFYGLWVKKQQVYGYVKRRHFPSLCRIAEENGFLAEAVAHKGIYYDTKKYHSRIGAVIGILLAIGMVLFLSDRVMMIRIGGNDTIPDERIISLLKDEGIYIGSSISRTDLRRAQRNILAMDKNIAWIGIKHTGSRVTVEIQEIEAIPQMQRKNTPSNIIAARDAQIKQVRVYNGMLIPMVGDAVKKGDLIVSGVVETKYGKSHYVHSIGEITGIYTEKMTFSQPLTFSETVTQGQVTKKAVEIFGKRFVYSSDGEVNGDYEYNEESSPLKLGDIVFPISSVSMHYTLTQEYENTVTEQEAELIIEEKIVRYENNFISDDVRVTDKRLIKDCKDGILTVTAVYTIEGEIGTQKPLFVTD